MTHGPVGGSSTAGPSGSLLGRRGPGRPATSPRPSSRARRGGPLDPDELGAVGVLTALTVLISAIGTLLPALSAVQYLSALPLAVLAERYRPRALATATAAGCAVSVLAGGLAGVFTILTAAATGGLVGLVRRRGGGIVLATFLNVLLGAVLGGFGIVMLLLFGSLRVAVLESFRSTLRGFGRAVDAVAWALDRVARTHLAATDVEAAAARLADMVVRTWWVWVLLGAVLSTVVAGFITWWLLGLVLRRTAWVRTADPLALTLDHGTPAPLPLTLSGVRFRYPGADADALAGVDLRVDPGERVALLGPNGSGKSTLTRVLAGAAPTSGEVLRPGAVGLGRPGGTALVMQRPDTQVLGTTVAEDLRWGLPHGHAVDVPRLLGLVGLAGFEGHPTHRLSGGQMQRLALAAALARRPALLISDESTAMVDEEGREELLALLGTLPERFGATLVHITHDAAETAGMRVVRMAGGRVVTGPAVPADLPAIVPAQGGPYGAERRPAIGLAHVSLAYGAGTPWEHVALDNVTLTVCRGEVLLITGGNGSGKSTLARVLAGLVAPTHGLAVVHRGALGQSSPVTRSVGRVALAFQHPRLQLARPTVAEDVLAAAGRRPRGPITPEDEAFVAAVLERVHLDQALATRGIDELSGGQQRRVALAGLLGADPSAVVLDEPLAGLDTPSRDMLVRLVAELAEQGVAVVVISHDVEELAQVADRHIRIESGRIA